MRILLVCVLLACCASQKRETPAPAATATADRRPPSAPAPAAGGATTASAPAARSEGGDDGPCATDADCAFTRVGPGACCPMLCAPRAVTKKAADALDQHVRSCAKGHECPLPGCRPERQLTAPACVQSRCVVKVRDESGLQ